MVYHTKAVTGTTPQALVVGDMPWLSYHISVEDTVRNAGRLIRDGGAEAVKLEGGRKRLPMVRAVLDAEIPVMGHLGLTPQSVHAMGGYRVQGKQVDAARELIADARALDEAGVFSIVLEGVPDLLAELITKEVSAPTIGIGAGRAVTDRCSCSTMSSVSPATPTVPSSCVVTPNWSRWRSRRCARSSPTSRRVSSPPTRRAITCPRRYHGRCSPTAEYCGLAAHRLWGRCSRSGAHHDLSDRYVGDHHYDRCRSVGDVCDDHGRDLG